MYIYLHGGFHKWGSPIAGWFIMENRKILLNYIKMDDLGIPPFQETSIYVTINGIHYLYSIYIYMYVYV